jgi:hypothetical protein
VLDGGLLALVLQAAAERRRIGIPLIVLADLSYPVLRPPSSDDIEEVVRVEVGFPWSFKIRRSPASMPRTA